MKPTLERLSQQFTQLIGPEAFAKAEAAIAAAKVAAAEAAAKAAATAAAAKAAADAAADKLATAPAAAATVAVLAEPGRPGSPTPATTPAVTPKPTAAPAAAAAPKPAVVAAPPPPLPLQATDPIQKGYNLDATVAADQVVTAARLLDAEGFGLDAVTGVDWIAQNEMELVYDYFHPTEPLRVVVRTRLPRATPEVATISEVFPGANWHERETHDFFGIVFSGHPNLKPFLLPEDATFHPLRKDYTP